MSDSVTRLNAALEGRYAIERELGEGGMATVYLAEDLKHERSVALKVLKPELAAVVGAERFLTEIKTTANLQHPNILPLFDSGEADGFLFYVMPYVEGETLADRLERESQLPVDEAVKVATEVSDALEAAHERGVIHRDIKPANILLSRGRPLVADFGIALAVSAAGGGRLTETGLSLGTPHYMSPEQATGDQGVGPATDIYALGSVLYEMLVGEPPYTGSNAQAILGKIIQGKPVSATEERPAVPANVDAAVRKALEKLPADRFKSAASFAAALNDPHFATTAIAGLGSAPSGGGSRAREMMGWSVAAALALVVGWLGLRPAPTSLVPVPTGFTLDFIGDGLRMGGVLVSPDGSLFALTTFDGIHIRPAGEASYHLLPNTERAISPAFSPDSEWLVFVREGVLVKVAVDGSSEQVLVRSNTLIASTPNWGHAGTVVFQSQDRLYRVSDAGGEPEVIDGGVNVQRPGMLPDGSGVLYSTTEGIMLLEFDADSARLVVPGGTDATYLETGHLVYGHALEGGLFAVPFDLASHAVIGNPVPVRDNVDQLGTDAFYSISRTGTLIYTTNPLDVGQTSQLLLLDMRGGMDTIPLSPRVFNWPRFSPDGERLAFNTGAGRIEQRTVYTYDLASGTTTPITLGGGAHAAAWSPDGTRMVFSSEQAGTIAEDLFITPIDGSSPPTRLLNLPSDDHALAWPSEDIILINAAGAQDILMVSPNSPERVTSYLAAEWTETELSVSPDGTLAAYESHEAGRPQVYVRSFPDAREVRLVSAAGGLAPRWAPDGQTVYYWSLSRDTLFAVGMEPGQPVGSSPEVVTVLPRLLPGWDVNPVSGRAVVEQAVEDNAVVTAEIVVVVNWFEELKERMGN